MRNFILDVLILITKILMAILAIPTVLAVIAGVMATVAVVLVTFILMSPIALVCVIEEYLKDEKNVLTKD